MNLTEILNRVIPILTSAASRGDNGVPLKVLASVQSLLKAGGRVGMSEMAAITEAIGVATSLKTLSDEDRGFLKNTWSELTASLEDYPYRSWEAAEDNGAVEISAALLRANDEKEGLQWNVRVIKSGMTKDGRHFYTPEAIRASVSLFDGAQCFADHAREGENPSVNNLVGWFSDPSVVSLENDEVAIEATLNVLETSPYAGLLREVYQRQAAETIGFSIHGGGKVRLDQHNGATVRFVEQITNISSVDLVTKPNAGGRLLDLRADIFKAADRLPKIEVSNNDPEPEDTNVQESTHRDDGMREELEELKAELQRQRLESGRDRLIESYNLPEAAMDIVRPRLDSASTLDEIESTLKEAQSVWSAALETQAQNTPILRQTTSVLRETIRMQGMIAGEPIDGVTPYGSLRQAFADITGMPASSMSPQQFANTVVRTSQGYDSEMPLMETIKTSDWSYHLGQAIYRQLIREYRLPGFDDWKKVVSNIGNLKDMRTNDRLRTGYYELLPVVGQDETYTSLTDPSEARAYYTPSKRGGLADYTWESALNDDLNQLRAIPKKLALSAKVTVWYNVLNIFASSTVPTCSYDSVALFHSTSHGANLITSDLSAANFATAVRKMRTQTVLGNSNISLGIGPKYMLIPPHLEATAKKLRDSDVDIDVSAGENIVNVWKNTFDIVMIPFWSDSDAWALVADPNLVPTIEVGFLGGRQEPELFTEAQNSGSNFTADRITYKIRHVWGYCILDHRGMLKSSGSG